MLECLGDEPCHFILIFDNGYFSEFGTFSITDWIGHTPKPLLAKNFGVPESTFDGFPKNEVYFARGALPPREAGRPRSQGQKLPPQTHKYRLLADDPHRQQQGGPAVAGRFHASSRSPRPITGAILDLDPGALRELHWHPTADEWQYVLEGKVSVTMFGSGGRYRTETLEKGDVGYIPQGYGHSIENVGDKPCRVLIGFNSGVYEDDRPVGMDRREPARRAGHQLRQAGLPVREVPPQGRVHRGQGRTREVRAETALRRNDERGPGRPTPPHPRLMVPPAGMRSQRQNCAGAHSSAPSHPSGVASAGPTPA